MNDYTIEEFCTLHGACDEGEEWAVENCQTMQDVWDRAKPDWLIWVATREGVLENSELRLFACWCVRQIWHLLKDERSKQVIEVAERFAMGEASEEELYAARIAAGDAAEAARVAVRDAASDAAWNATWAAARIAAGAAAEAARVAVRDAASDAAGASAWTAQAKYLRENCKPCFRKTEGEK